MAQIGRPFGKGNAGKPKGAIAKRTREARELAAAIVDRPAYLERLAQRVNGGRAPHMETLLWHYAHGKPKDTTDLNVGGKITINVNWPTP